MAEQDRKQRAGEKWKSVNVLEPSRDLDKLLCEKVLKFKRVLHDDCGWGLKDPESGVFLPRTVRTCCRNSPRTWKMRMAFAVHPERPVVQPRLTLNWPSKNILAREFLSGEGSLHDSEILLHVEPVHIAMAALVAYEVVTFQGVV